MTIACSSSTRPSFSFSQPIDELTQHDIRKTIIEDLQRDTPKFTGDGKQDVIKWLKTITNKFDTAGIPDGKRFDFISQLLDKSALDWLHDTKSKLNHFKSTFLILLIGHGKGER